MDSLDSYSIIVLKLANREKEIIPAMFNAQFPDKDHMFSSTLVRSLKSKGYLEDKMTGAAFAGGNSGIYKITPKGIAYLEDNKKQDKKERREKRTAFINSFRAWITLGIALVGLILSVYNTIQANILKYGELISFVNVHEEDYYFDGERLSKEISLIMSNNSQVSVSVVDFSLTRGGEHVTVQYADDSFSLPINLSSNNSIKQTVYIYRELEQPQIDLIIKEFGADCYINTFELDAFLEDGVNLYKGTTVNTIPSLKIVLTTSKGNQFIYESRGGASA